MSLFGGDSARPSISPSTSPASTPVQLNEYTANSQNAQHAQNIPIALDSDDEEDFEDSEEEEEDEEPEEELLRANKFTRNPQRWQRLTAADRQVAASLETAESADLAAHLYNAHNLKRRVRRPAEELAGVMDWQSKESWLKKGEDLQFRDPYGETETEFIPHKQWTAWPVPPDHIPKKDVGMQRAHSKEDTWCLGPAGAQDAGEAMREEVLTLLMQQAREKWLARKSEQEDEDDSTRERSRASLKAKSLEDERLHSVAESDLEMQDDGEDQGQVSASGIEPDEKKMERRGRRVLAREAPLSKPAFLADDDEARRILQPSVNSLLSRLDGLAVAVRRSRLNHLAGTGADFDRSESEFASDTESVVLRSRSRSQRSSKVYSRPTSRASAPSKPRKRLRKRPTRPKQEPIDDSDSASDYGADHKEQDLAEFESSEDISQAQTCSSRQGSDALSDAEVSNQVGLMDWSELLGIASMTGWNERAVARTAQRCAELFGESMSFRPFDEALATEPVAEAVQYTPRTIPNFHTPSGKASSAHKRPLFDTGILRCPHKDCWGSQKDFAIPYRTIEHVMRVHKYDPRTNNADNEERLFGGVHVDGFLQPITAKQGWLGGRRGRSRSVDQGKENGKEKIRKKQKKEKVESGRNSPFRIDDESQL